MILLKKLSKFCFVWIAILGISFNQAYGQGQFVAKPTQTSLVVNSKTGRILHDENSHLPIYPASLTKLMTLYLLFEAIETGKLKMSQKLSVSKKAEKMLPTKLGLKASETITVKDCIAALAIKSANDVAVVVAESIKGTEAKFVELMNLRARQLGMKGTNFANASGWHDPSQKSTARDLAKLAIAIKRDFPKYYRVFAGNSFVFRGKLVKGHNKVNETYYGAEGLKTGYTVPSGYNLITAATRQDKTLIAVVTGERTSISRNEQIVKLLDKHFGKTVMVNQSIAKGNLNGKLHKAVAYNKKAPSVKSPKVMANLKLKNKRNRLPA